MGYIIVLVLLLLAFGYLLFYCLRIVPQSEAYVVERLGSYHETLGNGVHFLLPIIDRVAKKVSLKEMALDFEPQAVITKDNVTMQIDTVVYLQVTEPHLFVYGVFDPLSATENLTATTLRNIIGNLELDETLTSRDTINHQMKKVIDEATDAWGIKVIRIELKNIIPPRDIQSAMEKQMIAERNKRESILLAQGQKEAMITKAEGQKQAQLMKAEADKTAAILKAQGEAEAIKAIYDAQVYGITSIKNAQADDRYVQLEALKSMEKVADGNATKIIVPSNLQDFASYLSLGKSLVFEEEGKVRGKEKTQEELEERVTAKKDRNRSSFGLSRGEEIPQPFTCGSLGRLTASNRDNEQSSTKHNP